MKGETLEHLFHDGAGMPVELVAAVVQAGSCGGRRRCCGPRRERPVRSRRHGSSTTLRRGRTRSRERGETSKGRRGRLRGLCRRAPGQRRSTGAAEIRRAGRGRGRAVAAARGRCARTGAGWHRVRRARRGRGRESTPGSGRSSPSGASVCERPYRCRGGCSRGRLGNRTAERGARRPGGSLGGGAEHLRTAGIELVAPRKHRAQRLRDPHG